MDPKIFQKLETNFKSFIDSTFSSVSKIITSPLIQSVICGETEILKALLKLPKFRKEINQPIIDIYHDKKKGKKSKEGNYFLKMLPIQYATLMGYQKTCIMLYENGGDINRLYNNPKYGYMINQGKWIDYNVIGCNCLLLSCIGYVRNQLDLKQKEKYREIIEYLLFKGCSSNNNCMNLEGLGCLNAMIKIGDVEIVKWLLLKGADPNGFKYVVSKVGEKKYVDFVNKLMKVTKSKRNLFFQTPIYTAVCNLWYRKDKCLEILNELLKYGADVNFGQQYAYLSQHPEFKKRNPLFISLLLPQEEIIEWLFAHNININVVGTEERDTPLTMSYMTGNLKVIEYLKRGKYNINKIDVTKGKIVEGFSNIIDYVFGKVDKIDEKSMEFLEKNTRRIELMKVKRKEMILADVLDETSAFKKNSKELKAWENNIAPKCEKCGNICIKTCSRCKSVFYCSKEHQVKDWKIHKTKCQKKIVDDKF